MITLGDTPVLHTPRLTLRAPSPQDWLAALAFYRAPRSSFIRDGEALTEGQCWRAWCHIIGSWVLRGYGSFVITLKGSDDAIGLAGPWHPIDWPEREIGWTLWRDDVEGKGYAFEAATAARSFAFATLGWDTAVSYIDPPNTRSIALAKRMGCTLDVGAPYPGTDPCLVYRHPAPRARA